MNTKISNKGFASLIFFTSQTMFMGIGLTQILNLSKQASIFSVIVGFLIGLLFLFIIFKLFNYEKDLNIFEKNEKLFGNIFGNIINFLLVILFLLYFIYTLWSLNLYIQNKYLDKTPHLLISLLYLLPVLYSTNKGIKTISKVSLIIFFLTLIEIILSVFGLTSFIEIDNLKPFFNIPLTKIFNSSLFYISYFLTPTLMLLCIPKNTIENPKKLDKNIILFYIISSFNFLLLFTFIIGVFGIELASLFYYPEFTLIKKINYFDFIQHVENILSSQWLFSFYITSTISIYFFKEFLNTKKIYKNNIFYTIIILCLILSCNLFKNTTIGYQFVKKFYILIYTIPLLIYTIISNILIKRNKN